MATLQTIADLLGVSRATVSNAYNRPHKLSPELRERVLSTAAAHGYAGPDPTARRLRTGRGDTVGVLFTEPLEYAFSDPVAVEFLAGLAVGLRPLESGLLLVAAPPGASVADAVHRAAVDGMCVYSMPERHEGVAAVLRLTAPVVLVDQPRLPDRPFVGIDDHAGGRLLGEHLLGLGHRRIAVLTSRLVGDDREGPVPPDRLAAATFRLFRERIAGLVAAGVEPVAIEERRNDVASGAAGTTALLAEHPTAVVALTDQLALGALAACRDVGLDVPGDVSVTGFDGSAAATAARLTTVAQPVRRKGEEAGRLLAAALDGHPLPAPALLPVHLVRSASTAPARH